VFDDEALEFDVESADGTVLSDVGIGESARDDAADMAPERAAATAAATPPGVAPTTTTSAFSAAVVPRVRSSRKVVKSVRMYVSPSIGWSCV
jgi:hypothetical protein